MACLVVHLKLDDRVTVTIGGSLLVKYAAQHSYAIRERIFT